MAKTVISTTTSYADPTDLTAYRDWRQLADLLPDNDTPLANSAAVEAHAFTIRALRTASAMIESAVFRGGRYTREDIRALLAPINEGAGPVVSVAAEYLKQLVCDLAFWVIVKRRKPDIDPAALTGVPEALGALEALRLGEAIFPFTETTEAFATDIAPFDPNVTKDTYVLEPVSRTSYRLFGVRARDLR